MPNLDLLPVELLERIATHLLGDAAYHHNLAALRLTSVRLATILSRFQAFTIPFNATFELSALPAFAKDLHILDSDFFFLGKGREPDGQGFRGGRSPDHEAVCIHNLKLSFVDQHEISLSSLSLNSFLVSESLVSLCLSSSKDNHHQLTIGKDLDQFHNLTSLSLVNLQVKDPYIFFQSLSSLHRLVHISICIANIQENEQPLNLDLSRLSPLLESISITGNYTSPVPLHLSATSTCPKLKTLILDCGISPDGPHWNHFPNLAKLELYDTSAIQNLQSGWLPSLTTLRFLYTFSPPLDFLAHLSTLEHLDIYSSSSEIDLQHILSSGPQLTNSLVSLETNNSRLSQFDALSQFQRLQSLQLSFSGIRDLSVLSTPFLSASLNNLSLSYNSNLIPSTLNNILSSFPNLVKLDLWKADIDSIDFLFNLTQLQEVVLSGNPNLTHIPQHTFSHLRQLSRLDLSETGISEISDWIGSDNNLKVTLEQLSLSRNPRISDFTAIGQLSRLKDLSLQENRITDFSFLKTLVVLEELDLSFNPITKAGVDYIHHLNAVFKVIGPNLRYLSMCEMGLEDISFLKYCFTISTSSSSSSSNRSGRLEELWLSRNPLLSKGLPILSSLVSLKFLWLQSTGITDLSILTPLIRIKSLGLSRNKGPLTRLESLLKLERMDGLFLYESITNPALLLSPPVARNPCLEREAFTCRQFQEILVANIGREDL